MVKTAGGRNDGQASVELVATIPALVIAVLLVAEFASVGYSLWSAGVAARAGARAAYVGGDGGRAARIDVSSGDAAAPLGGLDPERGGKGAAATTAGCERSFQRRAGVCDRERHCVGV